MQGAKIYVVRRNEKKDAWWCTGIVLQGEIFQFIKKPVKQIKKMSCCQLTF